MQKGKIGAITCFVFALSISREAVWCQLSITTANTPITQNFDALPNTGSSLSQIGGIFSVGWQFQESGTSTNNDQKYSTGAGTLATGDTYDFGTTGASDRALGMLQTGTLTTTTGLKVTNNTGQIISSLTIGYTGEIWRLNSGGDQLSFAYQIGDVPLNASTGWTIVASLSFTTPTTGTPASVDGNNGTYRTVITPVTITGLYIPNGTTITFRWVDGTDVNSAGMGIDDFTLTLVPASSDYFRTKGSGNWNTVTTWQKSSDGNTWIDATNIVPNNLSAGVSIMSGHTVDVNADLNISKLTIQVGGKVSYSSGLLTVTNSVGDDITLQGINSIFEISGTNTPTLNSGASFRIGTGAEILLSGNNGILNYQGSSFTYADGGIFEYSYDGSAGINGTFFSSQDAGAIPIFRFNSSYALSLGAATTTTINGKVEVSNGKTLNLSGVTTSLVIRNGITGAGNLTATAASITGTTAEIGGAGIINSNITIASGCTTTLSSDKSLTKNNTLSVDGILDLGTYQLQSAGGTASVSNNSTGVLKTANSNGLFHTSGSFKSGQFSLSFVPGSTVEYKASGNQTITTGTPSSYQNLVISGSGVKTAQSGANLTVQGSCIVSSGATLALTGTASENLYLNNSASLQIQTGGTFDNGGESSITSSGGSPSVSVSGTFITRDQQGFTGTNTSLPSIIPTLNANSIVEYGRSGDQTIQATITYQNLTFSGSGTKTPTSALSLNGTVTISGAVVLDGSTHTIGGITNNLVMIGNSRLKAGTTGAAPSMGGTYSLASTTTIEFTNSNATTSTIRQGGPNIQYANLEISGSNITAPLSGINMQAGATFAVKSGGLLKVTSPNGLYASSNAAILSANSPTIDLQTGSTIEYSASSNQAITTGYSYQNLTISGSGTKTASVPFSVATTFTRSGSASLGGTSPTYLSNATLAYVDATANKTYTQGLEWPASSAPCNVLVNLTGTGSCALTLSSNQTISGYLSLIAGALSLNDKTLQVAGNISGSGSFTGSLASRLVLNGGTSSLSFTPSTDDVSNALSTLALNSGSVTLKNKLAIYDTLKIDGGTLNLSGKLLVLKSSASKTAMVTEIKGTLNGESNVTVERYIPALTSRRYRLLTSPVMNTTINAAWQEGGKWDGNSALPSTGYGTLITGAQQGTATVANGNGFDYWSAISNSYASIKSYQSGATSSQASWQSLSSTLTPNAFNNNEAYLVFVRGDRGVYSGTAPGSTTLRSNGTLKKGSFIVPVPYDKSHTLLGNPYPSPLDFKSVYDANSSSIQSSFWIWQSSLGTGNGGYVLVRPVSPGSALYETIPGDGSQTANNRLIHSGQGFFVMPAGIAVAGNSITLQESHKSTSAPSVSIFRQAAIPSAKLYINLVSVSDTNQLLLDGVMVQFVKGTDDMPATDLADIPKPGNAYENLSILKNGIDMMLVTNETWSKDDTLFLRFWNVKKGACKLELRARDFDALNVTLILFDRYLNDRTVLNPATGSTNYSFEINDDAASGNADRFYLVFKRDFTLPAGLSLSAKQLNKAEVELSWKADNETGVKAYELESSSDGISFSMLTIQSLNATGSHAYHYVDLHPSASNYYRVKAIGINGEAKYSAIVKLVLQNSTDWVSVTPNLVKGNKFTILFNSAETGDYFVSLYTTNGQLIFQRVLQVNGSAVSQTVSLPENLPAGSYYLKTTNSKERTKVVKLFLSR